MINKPNPSMNKNTLSKKSVLMIATMLSVVMLTTSLTPSLVPVTAFAQEDIPDVESLSTQLGLDSTSEEDTSDGAVGDNNVIPDSTSEEDTSDGAVGDLIVDPITSTAVDVDANVNADTHVITDEEECEEANDEVNQPIAQSADQQEGRSDGAVGDNGVFVSPKTQLATQVALNLNVDTDVILVDGCNTPSDELTQAATQSSDQRTSSDVEGGSGSTIIIPSTQRVDVISRNIGIDNNVMQPVL
jgi:hypothetical protein